MSFLDRIKKQGPAKLREAVDKHGDKIAKGIDKAASTADSRTKGKYSDKIAKARKGAQDGLAKIDRDGRGPGGPGQPGSGPRPGGLR